jgi:hemolysin activation/secretion protein
MEPFKYLFSERGNRAKREIGINKFRNGRKQTSNYELKGHRGTGRLQAKWKDEFDLR